MNEPEPDNVDRLLVWTTLRPIQSDCYNLRGALAKLAEADPTFSVDDEDLDGEVIIRATGELHLEIICDRLLREHHIRVKPRGPKIIYLETVRGDFAWGRQVHHSIRWARPLRSRCDPHRTQPQQRIQIPR